MNRPRTVCAPGLASVFVALLLSSVAWATESDDLAHRTHVLNQAVIRTAEDMRTRGQSPKVRAYARRLLLDHRRIDELLLIRASELDLQVGVTAERLAEGDLPEPMQAFHESLARIGTMPDGAARDAAFVWAMIELHGHAVNMLSSKLPLVRPELAELLARFVPILEQHRALAEHLMPRLEPQAVLGGE